VVKHTTADFTQDNTCPSPHERSACTRASAMHSVEYIYSQDWRSSHPSLSLHCSMPSSCNWVRDASSFIVAFKTQFDTSR
jgi:hypothetical protein